MKIDPYMQRQNCRPMTLVSENIRYVDTCGGSSWRVPQMGVGLLNLKTSLFGDLSGYFFGNFGDKASNII